MSNYTSTPSFGRSSTKQWPPANPSLPSPMPSIFPPNFPFPPDFPGAQNVPNNVNNFDANSHLPGLGVGAPGPLPPPPFPFPGSLTPSQFPPPPFPPLQMPLLGYPPVPVPTAPMQTQQDPSAASENTSGRAVNAMGPQLDHSRKSKPSYDQEEGEVTDGEDVGSARPGNEMTGLHERGGSPYSPPGSSGSRDLQMETRVSSHNPITNGNTQKTMPEVEEGEASSVSRASSRASGSPYNPPMSVTAASPVPEQRYEPSDPIHMVENEKEPPSSSSRSPNQLRIQAQGALLSLAPHNIRFEELVGEGINPALLRQLYEEVGIKVPTSLPVTPGDQDKLSKPATPSVEQAQSAAVGLAAIANGVSPTQKQGADATAAKSPGDVQRPASASLPATTKPMERKEVIARMLAAKAAKASGPSPSPQANFAKKTSATPVEKTATATTLSETSAKDKDIPVREKNKAQTELARQRIEQLKKQGLIRNQKPQPDSVSQDQPSRTAAPPPNITMAGQHPLPERPPESEVSPARLPGLFMTGSDPNTTPGAHATPIQNLPLDPTPQPRVAQRKRPRASDFDELNDHSGANSRYAPGSAAPEERLVIDISDDEFYGDNEDDSMDVEAPAGQGQSHGANVLSSADMSASLTPQYFRNNDQEHLRQKDMEIQAMHRKIAELEHRKRAKLAANRSQSPRAAELESSNVTPAEPATTDYYNDNGMGAALETTFAEQAASRPSVPIAVPPTKDLALMNSTELETMRSKILRRAEIESGLPVLDAEIASSEAKLSELKNEEDSILSSIAKGKQGRQQLIGELEDLDFETNGLTLEELEEAQLKLESVEASSSAQKAPTLPPTDQNDVAMPDISLPEEQAREEPESAEEAILTGQEPQMEPDHESNFSGASDDNRSAVNLDQEASDSTGSSMDESTDSSSDSSDSDSQEEFEALGVSSPGRYLPEDTEGLIVGEQAGEETRTEIHPSALPEHIRTPAAVPGQVDEDDRASSAESEGYEPPEPEQDSGSESEYTPPPLSGEEPDVSPGPLPDQSQAEEPLTGNVQGVIAGSGGHVQNAPEVQVPDHKFTPYRSPLRHFKSYRYHPNYPELVSDGYRSLTYSHNIDSMKYLCPFESAGGICNDHSCEYQHFRDMTLSDDKILVQMGSLREGKTPEEKDQYIAGLKQIINDMRRDKVKDFSIVATEIAAYRRRFLKDPSRVLPL